MADDVRARKLQPIYNALDARNYKTAIKLCGKKDLEKWDVVKTLKAHALERLGRTEEALDLCREVKARRPTDDVVLSTLVMTFKATGQTAEATECYESALAQQPNHEEYGRELFFCYCRQCAYAKAQQLATKLYKQFAQPQYLFWAATCMKLQAPALGPPMGPKMIELAERMAEKALVQRCGAPDGPADGAATTAPSAEELELYVGLVEEQEGQTERALAALRRWTARRADAEAVAQAIVDERSVARQNPLPMSERDREAREGEMLLRLGRWDEVVALFRRRLAVNPDQWADWMGLLDASMQQQQQAVSGSGGSCPEVQATQALVLELQAAQPAFRGPYLAEMELLLRLAKAGAPQEQEQGLEGLAPAEPSESLGARMRRLLLAYLGRFGTKLCCFDDLLPYATALAAGGAAHLSPLVQDFERMLAENSVAAFTDEALQGEEERPAVVRRLQVCIRTRQLLRLLRTGPCAAAAVTDKASDGGGAHERRKAEVAAVSAEYSRTLFVNEGAEGGQREVQQGDELVLLAAHLLEEAAQAAVAGGGGGDEKAALVARLEAAVLLEQGLRYSPYNYHFRLALLATYDRLAAGAPAIDQYNQLEVKQVQLDTLSWLIYPGCLRHGFYTEARVRSRHLLAMHAASAREAHDHVARALGYGTYAKALEIERFQRTRMDRSLQLALARCEAARLELLQRHHGLDAALTYLRELASGMLPESVVGEREEGLALLPPPSASSAADAAPAASSSASLLSDNMDYLVVRDWRYRTRADEEAARVKRGERHVLRVRLWLVLQRALLAGLQGEASQVRDCIPRIEELLQALGAVARSQSAQTSANGHDDDDDARQQQARTQGWTVVLRCLQALPAVLEALACPVDADAQGAAAGALGAATASVTAVEQALLPAAEGEATRTLDGLLGGKSGLLDPHWLRSTSGFVAVAGAFACPLLQKLGAAVLHAGGGKRKSKKGKGGGGEGAECGGVPEPLVGATRGLLEATGRVLAGLEAALKAFDRAGDSAEPAEALAARELGERLWTFVAEPDFADLQAHVVGKLRSSHQLSSERLREVLRPKGDALRQLLE